MSLPVEGLRREVLAPLAGWVKNKQRVETSRKQAVVWEDSEALSWVRHFVRDVGDQGGPLNSFARNYLNDGENVRFCSSSVTLVVVPLGVVMMSVLQSTSLICQRLQNV